MDPLNSKFEDTNLLNSKCENTDPPNFKFEDTNLLNSKFENVYGKDPHGNKLNPWQCLDVAVLTCAFYGSLNF